MVKTSVLTNLIYVCCLLLSFLPALGFAVMNCEDLGVQIKAEIQYPDTVNGRTVVKGDWWDLPNYFFFSDLPYYSRFSVHTEDAERMDRFGMRVMAPSPGGNPISYEISNFRKSKKQSYFISSDVPFKEKILDQLSKDMDSVIFEVRYELPSGPDLKKCIKKVGLR
jgi:hypothetical protein